MKMLPEVSAAPAMVGGKKCGMINLSSGAGFQWLGTLFKWSDKTGTKTVHSDLRERLVEARKLYKAAVAALGSMRGRETEAAKDRVESAQP